MNFLRSFWLGLILTCGFVSLILLLTLLFTDILPIVL